MSSLDYTYLSIINRTNYDVEVIDSYLTDIRDVFQWQLVGKNYNEVVDMIDSYLLPPLLDPLTSFKLVNGSIDQAVEVAADCLVDN